MARVLKDEIKLCAHLPTKNCQISKNSAKIVLITLRRLIPRRLIFARLIFMWINFGRICGFLISNLISEKKAYSNVNIIMKKFPYSRAKITGTALC